MIGLNMKKLAMVIGLSVALATPALASPVPGTLSFTGRLSTSGGPVTTQQTVTFNLYTALSGGSSVWTEQQMVTPGNTGANAGLVYVELGASTPLDATTFDGSVLYLEITVGAETLSPRLPINSVPYAVRATDSDTVGGMPADSFVTSVTGSGGVHATGTNTVALSLEPCGAGQIYKYVSNAWTCSEVLTPAGSNLIAINNGAIGLAACGTVGFIAKYTAANTWQCAANDPYTQGTGIVIANNIVSINTTVVPQLAGANTFTGNNTFSGGTNSFAGTHSGNGAGLTSLNASQITTGTLGIGQGGTNLTTAGIAGSVAYSTGSGFAFNSQGTAGQVLTSGGAGQPTWAAPAGYVLNATNTTLFRSGSGTSSSPYTLAVDTAVIQSRVSGTCVVGSAIRVINSDGTVTCDTASHTTGVEDNTFNNTVAITTSAPVQLLALTVPGSPSGVVSLRAHVMIDRTGGQTDTQYDVTIRAGTCSGAVVGRGYTRIGLVAANMAIDIPAIGHETGVTTSKAYVLCASLFLGSTGTASIRGLIANW